MTETSQREIAKLSGDLFRAVIAAQLEQYPGLQVRCKRCACLLRLDEGNYVNVEASGLEKGILTELRAMVFCLGCGTEWAADRDVAVCWDPAETPLGGRGDQPR